jgi:hypothetical protein
VTAARTPAQRGAWSRNKGAKAERDLVAYLRQVGFGGAERAVRTGYRTTTRTAADPGDLTGTPGIVWSVKDCAAEQVSAWLDELDAMAADELDIRLLVHKRTGKADPGRWWCWMRLYTTQHLALASSRVDYGDFAYPVRMELGHVVVLLHHAGYGDQEVAS